MLSILKTYKMYLNGVFIRSESGRHQSVENKYNIPWASRKDFRNAVSAAEKASEAWSGRSAFNRGQIIYRIAEMLDSRRANFTNLLQELKIDNSAEQLDQSIDLLIYYAGWSDKYQQIYSNVNPVADYLNVSTVEPLGTIGILAPSEQGLAGLVGSIVLSLVSGNTSVVLVPPHLGALALTFAEVLHTSDVPKGSVNILTHYNYDLLSVFSTHLVLKGLLYHDLPPKFKAILKAEAAQAIKVLVDHSHIDWFSEAALDPDLIFNLQQVKTLWHPIGM